jgi:hypothetical protein
MPYVADMMTKRTYPADFYAPIGKPDYVEFSPIPVKSWDFTELNRLADVRVMLRSISGLPDSWLPLSTTSMHPIQSGNETGG